MPTKLWMAFLLGAALAAPAAAPAQTGQDYLTQTEAEQIRDAESANERVKLFLDFGADRLRRFQYELHISKPGARQADYLNDLMDAFSACIDDADGRIKDAMSGGEDVREGIKLLRKRGAEFAAELKKIKAEGIELKLYQDSLDDAVQGLQDAIADAEKAAKQIPSGSVKTKAHPGGHR
ncbi:MAG TPA: hypothetical protein VGS20_07650 [Candidatus Acidoferrales bacterium]|nr:hypothetical protein [Candidatus Acidoferrales bacterium]